MGQQQIDTFQDILDALGANPDLQRALLRHLSKAIQADDELRQELRKEILTGELLRLPVRFIRLEQAVENLLTDMVQVKEDIIEIKGDMVQVKEDLAEIKGDVVEIKQGVQRLEDRQNTMSGQIANLASSDYESKAIEQSRRLIRSNLAVVKATVIHASRRESQNFEESILLPAIAAGSITRQQADQLEDADSIIRCEDQDGNIVHAVAEISITVQDTDRQRATERAEILATITGTRAVPFVVGQDEEPPSAGAPSVLFLAYPG